MKPSKTSSSEVIDPNNLPWAEIRNEFLKDMNMIGWNVGSDSLNTIEDLEHLIKEKLKISPNEITALLYRMGIEENRAGLLLANKNITEGISEIAKMILKRSHERIILRKKN